MFNESSSVAHTSSRAHSHRRVSCLSLRSAAASQLTSNRLRALAAEKVVDDLNEVQIHAPRIRHGVGHLLTPSRAKHLEDQGLSPVNLLDDLDVVLVAP